MGTYDREEAAERATRFVKIATLTMIVSGVLLVLMPFAGTAITLGLAILSTGLGYGLLALYARESGAVIWRLLAASAFVIAAIYLLAQPTMHTESLSLAIAIAFFIEGTAEFAALVIVRSRGGTGWILVNATVTVLLALAVWLNWPANSAWILRTVVGVNLITSGLTRLVTPQATSDDR